VISGRSRFPLNVSVTSLVAQLNPFLPPPDFTVGQGLFPHRSAQHGLKCSSPVFVFTVARIFVPTEQWRRSFRYSRSLRVGFSPSRIHLCRSPGTSSPVLNFPNCEHRPGLTFRRFSSPHASSRFNLCPCTRVPLVRLAFSCYSIRAELFADLSCCQVARSARWVLCPARDFLPRAKGSPNRRVLRFVVCARAPSTREWLSRSEPEAPVRFLRPGSLHLHENDLTCLCFLLWLRRIKMHSNVEKILFMIL
jgi:hypothetical protein